MSDRVLETILIVEDDAADAALLRRGFEKAKVLNPILHFANGDDAFAYLAGAREYADRAKHPLPALILMDLKLPGMTGLQLLQWKRTQPEVRRIPVVVLTGDRQVSTVNAAYDLGANSYLVKPGNPADIVEMVRQIQEYSMELNQAPKLVMRAQS